MPINAQDRSLPDWFTRIRTRQTVLPRFQRFEAWSHANVTQLFNTILQGLPIGAVLVLEIGNDEPFIWRPLVGAPKDGERITEHLLDGQQRLTALWRGLHNNYEDRTYFFFLSPDDETGIAYYVDSIARWRKDADTERRPFWANYPKEQWLRRMIPLDLCAPGDDALARYREWAREAIQDGDERELVSEEAWKIRQILATFNLPFLSLPVATKKETALDVFIKMNTSAAPLSTYDIVVAQVEAGMGKSLHDLVAETKDICPAIAEYYPPDELTLAASALLQGRSPTNTSYMSREFGAQIIGNWQRYDKGVVRAAAFLEEERIFDAGRLPTDVVVPMLVALWADAPDGLDAEGRARSILRRYLWRAFFTKRYERATATRSLADYNELRAYLADSTASRPAILDDTQYALPEISELIAAGWPKKKDRLARAILALSLREGGSDLADGSTVSRANLARREYHHLFPAAHLRRIEVSDSEIYRALNCALVTWRTNRNISDKDPERYLAERRTGDDPDEVEIRTRLASHLIPHDEMVAGDYATFLKKRAELAEMAMKRLCLGGDSNK
ncbi:MAG: GmrSD restriction endonuclease domain-containing protein [Geminicoccaceae bacterium]